MDEKKNFETMMNNSNKTKHMIMMMMMMMEARTFGTKKKQKFGSLHLHFMCMCVCVFGIHIGLPVVQKFHSFQQQQQQPRILAPIYLVSEREKWRNFSFYPP